MKKRVIVWFRNDLRLQDNEALYSACQEADSIIPVYCFDVRHFRKTQLYGFPKTGIHRAKCLIETVRDLRLSLKEIGGDLIVAYGKPEEIIYSLAKYHEVDAVYCQEEVCSEEIQVEKRLERNLESIEVDIDYFWGSTLYHYDDLPMDPKQLPNVFTMFRKEVEQKSSIRDLFPIPEQISLVPNLEVGSIPNLKDLGFEQTLSPSPKSVLPFKGGETAALLRLKHYFWEGDRLQVYKETRNGLLGADYSSKFSPWLALGCISPRQIYHEVKHYEMTRISNQSTYWLIFELIWRDYFRFITLKYGNALFKAGGIKAAHKIGSEKMELFQKWANGETGIPFIDANMQELNATGFMSNRGRQNVASFLVKDMNLHWRMGAEYFESLLIDYDPCSNYGNWNYVAGIGNDPRENRYFNVLKQASKYDPYGDYVKHWLPHLSVLPSTRIHEPYLLKPTEQTYLKLRLGTDYPNPCINIHSWKARKAKS